MSSPYPPQPPRRLERSKANRILGGVCAGVANYLNMDPTLVRVLTVVVSLFTGVPVILYFIALFVVPEEGSQPATPTYPPVGGPQQAGYQSAPQQTAGYATATCHAVSTCLMRAGKASSASRRRPSRSAPASASTGTGRNGAASHPLRPSNAVVLVPLGTSGAGVDVVVTTRGIASNTFRVPLSQAPGILSGGVSGIFETR